MKQAEYISVDWTETLLYNLPDSLTEECCGPVYDEMVKAGYDVAPKHLINQWNCWSIPLGEFLDLLNPNAQHSTFNDGGQR